MLTIESVLITATIGGLSSTFRSPSWGLSAVSHRPAPAPGPRRMEGRYIQITSKGNNVRDRKGNGLHTPIILANKFIIDHLSNLVIQIRMGVMCDCKLGHPKFTETDVGPDHAHSHALGFTCDLMHLSI